MPGDTAPATEPRGASVVFGERLGLARAYARELGGSGVERGVIGPREVPRLWERHLLNCAAVGELIARGSRVVDVGSGAGLPGVALAIARPDLAVVLLEPLQRRVVWLEDVVARLDLSAAVTVHRGRAEQMRGAEFDVATARAVASLDTLAGWCLPLVRPGGELLAVKGQSAAAELAAAVDALRALGAKHWSIERCGVGVLETPTTVVRVVVADAPAPAPESTQRGGGKGRRRGRRPGS